MGSDRNLVYADKLAEGYQPFLVDDDPTGQLSEVVGRGDGAVRAGVYRVLEDEYPDRTPVPYYFEMDEYIWIIEGEVHVDTPDGEKLVLRAGDSAFFRQGSKSTWTFHAPFRKFSVEIQQVNG
ncbi:cupin domain-containing protein [Rhodococcus opacus]|uniref:Cupin domain-containing protein n=1 Tax=Rhodococcus opacus TaxID=37919 RepID=A0AAX3Y7Q9_RHOOP|nr:cupin domain-containing protein [Rhodococcus opacus]MCZ4590009.1 cupin domain-containing protein [Rhodococcus opacus]WLF44534.1 cupin domain-containing protein [Rhodococcus opacus]